MKVSELIEKLNNLNYDCECYTITADGVEKIVDVWLESDFTNDHKNIAYIEINCTGDST